MPKEKVYGPLRRADVKELLGLPEDARVACHPCGEEFTYTAVYHERVQFDESATATVASFKRRAAEGGYRFLHPRVKRAVLRRDRFDQPIHFRLLPSGGPVMAVVIGCAENAHAAASHLHDFKTVTAAILFTGGVRSTFSLRKEPTAVAAGLAALADVLLRLAVSDNIVVVAEDPLASLIETRGGKAGQILAASPELTVTALRPSAIPTEASPLSEAYKACQRVAASTAHTMLITTPAVRMLADAKKMVGPSAASVLDYLEGRRRQGASASSA